MTTLVLTIIGDDRAGLVRTLSEVIAAHHGNWTTAQLAQLAGKFAGIVLVDVPAEHADELVAALDPLAGLLDITVQHGLEQTAPTGEVLDVDIVGADRPGIVQQISDVFARADASVETFSSDVTEAPMAGGLLFTAQATVRLHGSTEALRAQLEALADELMVEFAFNGR